MLSKKGSKMVILGIELEYSDLGDLLFSGAGHTAT